MIGPDLTGVCLALFAFFPFIFRHTRKRTGGVGFGLGLGWVVGSSHFFLFFWNACMVVYGFAWFDRVGFLWEKM